jgi:hypothetical protein
MGARKLILIIGGRRWTLLARQRVVVDGDECWGATERRHRIIEIEKRPQTDAAVIFETLLHEIMHAAFHEVRQKNGRATEESVCETASIAIRRNFAKIERFLMPLDKIKKGGKIKT